MAVFGTKDRLKLKLINYVMIKNTFRCLLLGIVIFIINLIFINIVMFEAFKTMSVVHTNLNINSPYDRIAYNVKRNERDKSNSGKETIPFVISLCYKASKDSKNTSSLRSNQYFRETFVLLKSMVLSTKQLIRIILLSDMNSTLEYVQKRISKWPTYYQLKLRMEYKTFKARTECLDSSLFIPCTAVRLYYHEILPQEEAVVHLDTDLIFLKSPENILAIFKNFSGEHLIGAAPDAGYYGLPKGFHSPDYPYYGNSGLQAGLLMMNLTRIREFSLNFTQVAQAVCASFKRRLVVFDQGILNIIFSEYPNAIYNLDCRWNFIANHCFINVCPKAVGTNGEIFAVQGTGRGYFVPKSKKFQKLFQAFEGFDLDEDPAMLEDALTEQLNAVEEIRPNDTDVCRFFSGLGKALLSHVHIRNSSFVQGVKV